MILETLRLIAAGAAAVLFLVATFLPQRPALDHDFADRLRASRWIAAGSFAAAIAFALEVAVHFWPDV